MSEEIFEEKRQRMIEEQIKKRGITDTRVLEAMKKVPRHEFVPDKIRSHSYNDEPLSIGEGQTISQPYIVAYMTEVLKLADNIKVLEIGTGSGYQTAILAELVREVYTVEIIESLSIKSRLILAELGYENIQFKVGDGTLGWKEFAPFDAIIVTAAPRVIPQSLKEQLSVGGKLIVPVGDSFQDLVLVQKSQRGFTDKKLLSVRFVPLVSSH
ncbi:MAG: protein-L-isoaspartate(D-aspartate) O-methyltransferase [Candidatus Aminicenantes bacterium]|nr:protein-L-isoaspartate(D-aspartate) O-methyltransferase [Candidatus Aminicenantes bacterium]